MKKILFLLLIASLVLAVSSCKRTDVSDPPWDGPAGFNILVEGSASPAVILIDGVQHISRITVRATDWKGAPLAGRTILFQQTDAVFNWLELGFFQNSESTIRLTTDGNGQVVATFFVPGDVDFPGPDAQIYIRAVLIVDGRVDGLSLPQDYISILLMHAN
jgi:hypothetical protein